MSEIIVFISYSHDSDAHRERVLRLSQRLHDDGICTILDRYVEKGSPPEGWPRWMLNGLDKATHVLCVCTETYYRRFRGLEVPDKGKGVDWEGDSIIQNLYDSRSRTNKFIPILFEHADEPYIPEPLRPQSHYVLDSEDAYWALYDALLDQSGIQPGAIGELKRKPRQTVQPLTFGDNQNLPQPKPFTPDTDRILRYAPEKLIGREAELKLLNDAWAQVQANANPRPHVMTFVALGGEGKTSLVAHWTAGLANQGWPGCEAAFAWSFYSQGTREQAAASSDLFLREALIYFGDAEMANSPQTAYDKAKRLARLVCEQRALLILDGLEPLQYAPTSPQPGQLKDQAIAALLKGLAASSLGLCLVTTRCSVTDLQAYRQTTAPETKLLRLSKAAGVKLLRGLGVHGRPDEFEQLVEDVRGHALTLNLLGSYLRDAHGGDIRQRDRVKLSEADAEEQSGHAFRVMDTYVQWLENSPPPLAVVGRNKPALAGVSGKPTGPMPETVVARPYSGLPPDLDSTGGEGAKSQRAIALWQLLGLFDRPATADCLQALQLAPAIPGLTETLVGLSEAQRNLALSRLESAKLLTINRNEARQLLALDAHPLIREYFAQKLRTQHPEAWREAHKRLYQHLCATTKDLPEPTLEDLQPLYQAVAHGCLAGLQQEACVKVYRDRINRGTGSDGFYSIYQLGAFGADLGAVAGFFENPWNRPSPALTEADQAWLLSVAAFNLRALGRLHEALEPMRSGLEMGVQQENWKQAAIRAGNLSELELSLGAVASAIDGARQSVNYADRSGDAFQQMGKRTTLADALHQAGQRTEAEALFREAEALQAERQPDYPLLYSLPGFRYCDCLLADAERAAWQMFVVPPSGGLEDLPRSMPPKGGTTNPMNSATLHAVKQRATQTLKIAERYNWLLDIGLDHLTLARTALYQALLEHTDSDNAETAINLAVTYLRRAGRQDILPLSLLTRAWLRVLRLRSATASGPHALNEAIEDLNEAWDIAERGPMPLFMVDIHLHRARLFGRVSPYPWESPQADLAESRRLIVKHGYGRRKQELEDAERALGIK